jgi:hypothetical protein
MNGDDWVLKEKMTTENEDPVKSEILARREKNTQPSDLESGALPLPHGSGGDNACLVLVLFKSTFGLWVIYQNQRKNYCCSIIPLQA